LDRLDEDETFRARPEGDISLLATDLARLGQLYPIDVRPGANGQYQVICGFRRVAALKFIQRTEVIARVHRDLSDGDALLMALAAAIHATPASLDDLRKLRGELEARGVLAAAARDMLDKALAVGEALSSETVEEEIDADELSQDVTLRLAAINQDLSLLADVFDDLEPEHQQELLRQLRYSADLIAYLESGS
jgi:ParB-like chromosome segregation protein Spo0J